MGKTLERVAMTERAKHRGGSTEAGKLPEGMLRLVKRPITWFVGILVVAVGGVLTNTVQRSVDHAVMQAMETGDPVLVVAKPSEQLADLWLPPAVKLSDEDLARLNGMNEDEQYLSLKERGARPFGSRFVEIILTGNQSKQVQVTDLRPVSDCARVEGGSLVKMLPPSGNTLSVNHIVVDVEDASASPAYIDVQNPQMDDGFERSNSFFARNSITLQKDETEELLIRLDSSNSVCRVDLEITAIVAGEEFKQKLLGAGEEVYVSPFKYSNVSSQLSGVYMGGVMCDDYVVGPQEWIENPSLASCGPGNEGGIYGR